MKLGCLLFLFSLVSVCRADLDCTSEGQSEVSFDSPSLKGKKCSDVDRDSCIFTSDAKSKCPCVCKKIIYGGGGGGGDSNTQGSANQKPCKGLLKKCNGKKFCFHADDTVMTENGQRLSMQELAKNPNLRVMTGQQFSSVRYWLHAEKKTKATFLVLSTASGHRLRISSEHLIYRSVTCHGDQMDTVFASRLKPGHCLSVHDVQTGTFILSPVTNVTEVIATGIYAPITHTGNIVVNGVLASCYTNYEDEEIQKIVYGALLTAREWLTEWGPLKSIGELIFGQRNGNTVAHIPWFVYSLLDLSAYFVHA